MACRNSLRLFNTLKTKPSTVAFQQWPAANEPKWLCTLWSFSLHWSLQRLVISPKLHHAAKPQLPHLWHSWHRKATQLGRGSQNKKEVNLWLETTLGHLSSHPSITIPVLTAFKALDDVLLVPTIHGILLKALAIGSLKLLVHLIVVFLPGFWIVQAGLHFSQIAHEIPLTVSSNRLLRRNQASPVVCFWSQ